MMQQRDREGETRHPPRTREEDEESVTDSILEGWAWNERSRSRQISQGAGRGAALKAARDNTVGGRDDRTEGRDHHGYGSERRPDTSRDSWLAEQLAAEPDTRGDGLMAVALRQKKRGQKG